MQKENGSSDSGDTTPSLRDYTEELLPPGAKGHHADGGAVFQMRCKTEF